MGLRAKLAVGFLVPLAVTTLAIALLETGHTTQTSVDNLASLGNLLVRQTFEEMRADKPANLQALRDNRGFRDFLSSVLAFGEGVVSVRIEDPHGIAVVAEPEILEGRHVVDVPSIHQLQAQGGWWETLSMFLNLQPGSIYKTSGVVQMGGLYAGTIKIELSTELIAARVRRSIRTGLYLIGLALVLGSGAGTILVGTVLRSVTALTAGIEQLAASQTGADIKIESRDELGQLADKFNLLSRRIMADRRQWEQERNRLVSAVRSISDAVVMLNSAGRVMFANPEALGRLGLPDGITVGKNIASLLGRDHPLVRLAGTALSAAYGPAQCAHGSQRSGVAAVFGLDDSDGPGRRQPWVAAGAARRVVAGGAGGHAQFLADHGAPGAPALRDWAPASQSAPRHRDATGAARGRRAARAAVERAHRGHPQRAGAHHPDHRLAAAIHPPRPPGSQQFFAAGPAARDHRPPRSCGQASRRFSARRQR